MLCFQTYYGITKPLFNFRYANGRIYTGRLLAFPVQKKKRLQNSEKKIRFIKLSILIWFVIDQYEKGRVVQIGFRKM